MREWCPWRGRTSTAPRKFEATNYEKGADGELETTRALAELTVTGWRMLYDRCLPYGGNIDHIAVGPAGIVVGDAKAWFGPVTVDAAAYTPPVRTYRPSRRRWRAPDPRGRHRGTPHPAILGPFTGRPPDAARRASRRTATARRQPGT